MSKNKEWLASAGTNTKLCHTGYEPSDYHGFVNPPVVHASTVLFPNARSMETITQRYTYGTRGTPTTDALCNAINELEGSAGTILVPSGLAAITVGWDRRVMWHDAAGRSRALRRFEAEASEDVRARVPGLAEVLAVEDLLPAAVDDLPLLVHDLVVLEDVLADLEVAVLHRALRALDRGPMTEEELEWLENSAAHYVDLTRRYREDAG